MGSLLVGFQVKLLILFKLLGFYSVQRNTFFTIHLVKHGIFHITVFWLIIAHCYHAQNVEKVLENLFQIRICEVDQILSQFIGLPIFFNIFHEALSFLISILTKPSIKLQSYLQNPKLIRLFQIYVFTTDVLFSP